MRDILRARAAARALIPDAELLAWAVPRYFYHVNPDKGGALVIEIMAPGRTLADYQGTPTEFLDWLGANTPANIHRNTGKYMLHAARGEHYVCAYGNNLREALHGARALWQDET
jgi:hypothetical protein